MARAYMTTPCENCPYRLDAPRRLWHREEFEKTLLADADPIGAVFACHKQGGLEPEARGFCAGWALDQKARGVPSVALRLELVRDPEALSAFDRLTSAGVGLFRMVRAMCRANGVWRVSKKARAEWDATRTFGVPGLVLLLATVLAGCSTTPQAVERSSNGEVAVSLLTTWDDGGTPCKLWRVETDGKNVYVARCGGDARAYEQHTTGSGKHRRTVRVEALTVEAAR